VQALESQRAELEKRIQRQQEEILVGNATVERLTQEKQKMNDLFEEAKAQFNVDLENMRKRKDKYKLLYMEANAKVEASRMVMDSLSGDRSSLLQTIKAQQHVVEEQSAAVKRLGMERKATDEKSRKLERTVLQKEDDLRLMAEALREYQNAATEFIYENHTMQREAERLAKENLELQQLQDQMRASSPQIFAAEVSRGQTQLRNGMNRSSASPARPRSASGLRGQAGSPHPLMAAISPARRPRADFSPQS
jgi:hypothetical protein